MKREAMCTKYTRHKYIEHIPSKPTTTGMREKGIKANYANVTSTTLTTTQSQRNFRESEPAKHIKRQDKADNNKL